MTQFCTWNIPTLFRKQFLSFLISTAEKCFRRILTNFPTPGTTGASKAENRVWKTRFNAWNIPTLCKGQFLSFPISTKKNFGRILTTFPGPGISSAAKVENEALITTFGTWNTYSLWYSFYCFPSVRLKNVWVEFWWLFGPGLHRSTQSWKSVPDDSVLTPETYPHYLGRISCRFSSLRLKSASNKFSRLFRAPTLRVQENLKTEPNDSM